MSSSDLQLHSVVHGQESIKVGNNILNQIPKDLKASIRASRFVAITDENVWKLYGETFLQAFKNAGVDLLLKVIEPGEASKCRRVKEGIEDWMISNQCNRDTCMIAFGGGVVGDLTGFVAATYLRGVPFVQIPTTLLAMVDSSIGGKTGVDTEAAKNMIGSFHHPRIIYIDLSFLKSLPKREFCNGMAEVIKTAAIRDKDLFEVLENNVDKILERDMDILHRVVMGTASIKAEIVSMDDKEGGIRAILNFGHTIGHAIETLANNQMLHGEAVAIGMVLETKLSYKLKLLQNKNVVGRLVRCIQAYKLPLHTPKTLDPQLIIQKMMLDKKNLNRTIRCVIIQNIGSVINEPVSVTHQVVESVLLPYISVTPTKINGQVTVPGSKSISNRVLPLCALAEGTCRIHGLLSADDTRVMLDALQELGVPFHWEEDGSVLVVEGGYKKLHSASKPLFLGNAGTASRFLTTMCTLIKGGSCTLTGTPRLKERPIKHLTTSLINNGCGIKFLEQEGHFPVEIQCSGLKGGDITLSANVSSQYVSSILLSAPYAEHPVTIKLLDDAVSRPFIDMTVSLMKQFGVQVTQPADNNNIYIVPKTVYKPLDVFIVESDASSASYPLAMAAITGGEVTVQNIGKNSIQGDAKFYTVLEQMGCSATQTETSTTVRGPSDGKLKAVKVDMADMTDTFMTVAVLAAIADGTSVIHNIANQRVKECNRLAAMVTELTKCGIQARELEDGIEIVGIAGDYTKIHGAEIDCYLDHRIAMSFATLGCRVPGIVIKDRDCVDKTYPEFWMDLESIFGAELKTHRPSDASTSPIQVYREGSDAFNTIIVIGMRGSGKTTLGNVIAKSLNCKFIDMDHAFIEKAGCTISDFVAQNGWPAFRKREYEVFREVLADNPVHAVLSSGGGIIETPEPQQFLQSYPGLVLQLHRNIKDVCQYLNSDTTRANLGEDPLSVWNRRQPHYTNCSKFEFYIKEGDQNWKLIERDLATYVQSILQRGQQLPHLNLVGHQNTFFLSLTYKDMKEAAPALDELSRGVDALELRVDLLASQSPDYIREQVAVLRRYSKLPVIFTVRSKNQGGQFEGSEAEYFQLLTLALRLGCEYIDVEVSAWSPQGVTEFINLAKRTSLSSLIASVHDFKNRVTETRVRGWFNQCTTSGCHISKVVGMAHDFDDNFLIKNITDTLSTALQHPCIGICAGEIGKMSRVTNKFLTPVTHPSLPTKAAPGQMSVAEIMHIRQTTGMALHKKFYLYGSNIQYSKSPLIHNTSFQYHCMPYDYHLCDTPTIEAVVQSLRDPNTFGGSVTIPHKQDVLPHLDHLSESAASIGAVNTIWKVDGKLHGDNTDWVGMYNLIKHHLVSHPHHKKLVGLVVGAGGTANAACYTLRKLGAEILIYNRTVERASKLAERFHAKAITTLDGLKSLDIVIGTVPSSANFELPSVLLSKNLIVVELAYSPRETALVKQARSVRCVTIEGIEILVEQGLAAFHIWTGKQAPRRKIIEELMRADHDLQHTRPLSFEEEL